jgi:hypothetical protein
LENVGKSGKCGLKPTPREIKNCRYYELDVSIMESISYHAKRAGGEPMLRGMPMLFSKAGTYIQATFADAMLPFAPQMNADKVHNSRFILTLLPAQLESL